MKKTFPLALEGKHPERLLEATKHEIRKYIKRERRRVLPEGVDYWDFDCKFGASKDTAVVVHLQELTALIDGMFKEGAPQFYVEILATHGHRKAAPASINPDDAST
jgi:hypothetical protein